MECMHILYVCKKVKVKESRNRPGVSQRIQGVLGSRFHEIRHVKLVRLSASRTDRLYSRKCSWYLF